MMGTCHAQSGRGANAQAPPAAMQSASKVRMPCVFINHGGGPMPLMGRQPELAKFLSSYATTLPETPSAILIVTAHWETPRPAVTSAASHKLLFDYGGFPSETYKYQYPAPGEPALAQRVQQLLAAQGLPCDMDRARGWDHGVFVPLMLMFPDARIPVVALSVFDSQDAAAQIDVGRALQPLRDEGVLIVGSGASFHNFKYFFGKGAVRTAGEAHAAAFDRWLQQTIVGEEFEEEERRTRLGAWAEAPSALECHPPGAAEHLMPLFAIFGAAGSDSKGCVIGKQFEPAPAGGVPLAVSQFEFS